jgi:hypothetical protein
MLEKEGEKERFKKGKRREERQAKGNAHFKAKAEQYLYVSTYDRHLVPVKA